MRTKLSLLFLVISLENRVEAQKWKTKWQKKNKLAKEESSLTARRSTEN